MKEMVEPTTSRSRVTDPTTEPPWPPVEPKGQAAKNFRIQFFLRSSFLFSLAPKKMIFQFSGGCSFLFQFKFKSGRPRDNWTTLRQATLQQDCWVAIGVAQATC